jgi:hypothetical protein
MARIAAGTGVGSSSARPLTPHEQAMVAGHQHRLLEVVPRWSHVAARLVSEEIDGYLFLARLGMLMRAAAIGTVIDRHDTGGHFGQLLRDHVGWQGLLVSVVDDDAAWDAVGEATRLQADWMVVDARDGDDAVPSALSGPAAPVGAALVRMEWPAETVHQVEWLSSVEGRLALLVVEVMRPATGLVPALATFADRGVVPVEVHGFGGRAPVLADHAAVVLCHGERLDGVRGVLARVG